MAKYFRLWITDWILKQYSSHPEGKHHIRYTMIRFLAHASTMAKRFYNSLNSCIQGKSALRMADVVAPGFIPRVIENEKNRKMPEA